MNTHVVLVNSNDEPIGLMPKLEVHQKGLLHRAFSIFIVNANGEIMMQQRVLNKYHSGGLWTNTCCSHPGIDEPIQEAANRRLKEEMNISCDLMFVSKFIYKAEFGNGLIEHEYDHVFFGYSDDIPVINKSEASDWKWMNIDELKEDLNINPSSYTVWLKPALEQLVRYLLAKKTVN